MPAREPVRLRRLGLPLVLAAVAAGIAFGMWKYLSPGGGATEFRLARVERGNVTSVVSASGTLNAVTTVLVGSQISGQIKELLVDFNSVVKSGQLLARIDPETYAIRVRQAEADLEAARTAAIQKHSDAAAQRSQLLRAKITYDDAKRDLDRKQSLVEKGFVSGAELDKATFTERGAAEAIRTAEAQVKSADAQVANAAAVVKQREAALAAARNDLSKTAITAPVDGVVISRQVDAGQTVAASLNTPTLFTIAKDLRDMQVEVAIDESDIGRIRQDQKVTFTVDAFSGRSFDGRVRQIRKAAQTVQNVVTYTVVVETPNPSLLLVPGMTANVRIVADSRENVLKVPNAALRWRPAGAAAAKDDPVPAPAAGPGGGGGGGGGDAGATPEARRGVEARRKPADAARRNLRRVARQVRGVARRAGSGPPHARRAPARRGAAEDQRDARRRPAEDLRRDRRGGNRSRGGRQRARLRPGSRRPAARGAPAARPHRRQRDGSRRRRRERRRRGHRRHGRRQRREVVGRQRAAAAVLAVKVRDGVAEPHGFRAAVVPAQAGDPAACPVCFRRARHDTGSPLSRGRRRSAHECRLPDGSRPSLIHF
ncbi:MAG: efflux RND transporter periplasmic adaptor subunit [Betaproteobacteria bacterium]|nr:efflux RND transporter periplasmic adaptor subunit [Betaproteobacteria bacterium]